MPLRLFIVVVLSAMLAAGLTIAAGLWLFPESPWSAPGTMAVLAGLALVWHFWINRK